MPFYDQPSYRKSASSRFSLKFEDASDSESTNRHRVSLYLEALEVLAGLYKIHCKDMCELPVHRELWFRSSFFHCSAGCFEDIV